LADGVLDQLVDLLDLRVEEFEVFFEHAAQGFILNVAGAVGLGGALGFEVFATGDQFGQKDLLGASSLSGLEHLKSRNSGFRFFQNRGVGFL
jgi:hypothetical protein